MNKIQKPKLTTNCLTEMPSVLVIKSIWNHIIMYLIDYKTAPKIFFTSVNNIRK